MDENQISDLLKAIAISSFSSPELLPLITHQSRSQAFSTLEQFKEINISIRMPVALRLLQTECHILPFTGLDENSRNVDVTTSTKLYALDILQSFIKTSYIKLSDDDRLSLRNSVVIAARQLLVENMNTSAVESNATSVNHNTVANQELKNSESRILGMKIATLIANLTVRDFPQRWTTFIQDIFIPPHAGGLWHVPDINDEGIVAFLRHTTGAGYGPMIGVKICLESLKIITEDCTDSDFNAKISTVRRNDILIGLNEVNQQFLPLLFTLISGQYSIVSNAQTKINEMLSYLSSNGRSASQMTKDEKGLFDQQVRTKQLAGRVVADCLKTIEKFCQSMPLSWILNGGISNQNEISSSTMAEFITPLLHLLREDTAQIQIYAVKCIEQLSMRKLEFDPWMRLLSSLPQAVSEANEEAAKRETFRAHVEENGQINQSKLLVEQLSFYQHLSRMLAQMISGHLAHITNDKDIANNKGANSHYLAAYLNLMADMLAHPSGRVCGEQINTWITLLRDPQLTRTSTHILRPYMERVMTSYMFHMVKIRWEDIDAQKHPLTALIQESWDEEESYNSWLGDVRSKSSLLFRFAGRVEPKLAASLLSEKVQHLISSHGGGEPRDHIDPDRNQLTPISEAIMKFEGIFAPMENILQGIPDWALDAEKTSDPSYMEPTRIVIRNSIRSSLGTMANMILNWNPSDTWLKFRRVTLLEALKYYWKYDPITLPSGIEVLLGYLIAEETNNTNLKLSSPTSKLIENRIDGDIISLRKRSGCALISISKRVPHLLVTGLEQLSQRVKILLSSNVLLPTNQMHLYEFLSCVVTAVKDPVSRTRFLSDVLAPSFQVLESQEVKDALSSVDGLMNFMGISQVVTNPSTTTDPVIVKQTTANFSRMFSSLHQLAQVGRRCHEAAKKRPNGGIPLCQDVSITNSDSQHNYPDEGSVSINDLAVNDPFVPLWPRILPILMRCLDVILTIWHPSIQSKLLKNPIQRYALAISDDEVYLSKKQDNKNGGVFGKGGTAGSVVSGWHRRDMNLAPKWSGWFNELRNTCFQLLGLLAVQRVLYAPEVAPMYQSIVDVVANPTHLNAMEHRHITQYIKQFVEILLLSCPSTLYPSHLSHILGPLFEHMQRRLQFTWAPLLSSRSTLSDFAKPLTTASCDSVVNLAENGGDEWFTSYYERGGLFIGDVDIVTGEAILEKVRVELGRSFSDMIQVAMALKGDWALVLANQAKEDQALKKTDSSKLKTGPNTKVNNSSMFVNADGTSRNKAHIALEARKNLRINALCQFLLLGNDRISLFLIIIIIQCLEYPDAYTCRRCIRICHRILETVAPADKYTEFLGSKMFLAAVKTIVAEPKWMVGLEWDMINVLRDIYGRLTLGQWFLFGGQGAASQQVMNVGEAQFEQSKTVDKPLLGGGILRVPSDLPKQILVMLPGISPDSIIQMDEKLKNKRAAKDQKDILRDFLRVAAENMTHNEHETSGIMGRATASESLLSQNLRQPIVPDLPEKLVTHSMILKKEQENSSSIVPSIGNLFKMK